MLAATVTELIQVQHWLGHSTMLITVDLYSRHDASLINVCGEEIKNFNCQVQYDDLTVK